ncbi:hypothetical protein [Sodalinema gerasimenkoae]|uniref:hypothetical protein n=1 Tax=Sodalinema gerasimenkoae TaxID=2862348 RepID=UPI001358BB23|nr:hypothetical protein [Sodalinema gerasimenkoae]
MESIKVKAHVGQDGVLSLQLPVKNQDVEAMVIYQLVQKRSHQGSKQRFQAMLAQHQGQTFSDSTELFREDRRRG